MVTTVSKINSAPTNLTFRSLDAAGFPTGWFGHEKTDGTYRLDTDDKGARDGGRCARITAEEAPRGSFGAFAQRVDATSYIGKRVRFTAWVRAEAARAVLWARIDRADGQVLDIRNTTAGSEEWSIVSSTVDVPDEASEIRFGFFLGGNGTAWCDEFEIEIVGSVGEGDEPARALDARGLDNLTALAKMVGYVRHFHPSDEAARADWDLFAVAGVQRVEACATAQELTHVLEDLFRPVAPSARVFPTGTPVPDIEFAGADRVLRWRHSGIDLRNGRDTTYASERLDDAKLAAEDHGVVRQYLDATPLRSRRVTLSARVETTGDARASIAISTRSEQKDLARVASDELVSSVWSEVNISLDVPEGAEEIVVELRAEGDGLAKFTELGCSSDGPEQPRITNIDLALDDVGRLPLGWTFEGAQAGYECKLVEDGGTRSILIEAVARAVTHAPRLGECIIADLGGGVSCAVPLAVPADDGGTLPRASTHVARPDKPEAFIPTGSDRSTRLAAVALAWNVFQHFYPYFDEIECDWHQELRTALSRAATDANGKAFLSTLQRLVAALHDGHGGVYAGGTNRRLPLRWRVIGEQLVVTASAAEEVAVGDVVSSIDGEPAMRALQAAEQETSGATPGWRRYVALSSLLTADDPVTLEVVKADGALRNVMVAPAGSDVSFDKPDKIYEAEEGIWYLDIDRINDADFTAALPDLERASGIVFDLRGYPRNLSTIVLSHLIDDPIQSAQWRIPQLMRPDRADMRFPEQGVWSVEPIAPRLRARVAFCIGPGAISYAETYMGMVEHYGLADIVGSPTAGTNGNVNPFVVPGEFNVVWTGMKVTKHDGSPHHGVGILPTIAVEPTIEGVRAGRDEVLETALRAVRAP